MSEHPEEEVILNVELPDGMRVRITVEELAADDDAGQAASVVYVGDFNGSPPKVIVSTGDGGTAPATPYRNALWGGLRSLANLRAWPLTLAGTLFALALIVYLATRLIGLTRFPIYFFTDEAVQSILAADLVRDGFRNYDKVFLPTFFKNGDYYNLSVSVYLQVIPYLFFGKSAFVTRAISVLISLLAAVSVGLILRDFFNTKYWWSATLLLSITPAWFLHSRTAFETVLFVSFYAGMLYFYLAYRCRSPRHIYATLILAGLAFYSYSPGQVVVGLTGLALFFIDIPYHWRNRKAIWKAVFLAVVILLPYLRFQFLQSDAATDHLRRLNSYWLQPLPLGEKMRRYFSLYRLGLSVPYWFIPNEYDLSRHLMKGYGHLHRATLPFYGLGLIWMLRHIRKPAVRVILVALLIAPAGSALVGVGITRLLVFVVPAVMIIAIGIDVLLAWLERPGKLFDVFKDSEVPQWIRDVRVPRGFLAFALFTLLVTANLRMAQDALVNGPLWYKDYGMGGLQYGAVQIFPLIEELLEENPGTEITLTPTWTNGADVVARFFLSDPLPIAIGSIEGYLIQHLPLTENKLFIVTPDEYEKALASEKFTNIRVEHTLPYPDGRPGFYFIRIEYVQDIDAILEAERLERRKLLQASITREDGSFEVHYPTLDLGEINNAFDGDDFTLLRTLEANPAVFEIHFEEPRRLDGVRMGIGSTEAQITIQLYSDLQASPIEFSYLTRGSVEAPDARMEFDGVYFARVLRIELKDIHQEEPAHVHVWEIEFLEP